MTPQALQELSFEDQTRFLECAGELCSHADKTLERRSWSITRYVEKATFYIRCLHIGRDVPTLELRSPLGTDGDTCSALSDVQQGRQVALWLHGFCLSMMRGLNFLGNDVDGKAGSGERFIDFILEQLGFRDVVAPQLLLPGGRELVALTHYKFASKLRMLGRRLRQYSLVRKAASGQIIWDPACDQFSDPSWTWQGEWPKPGEPSEYPHALDPGFMLPAMEAAGTHESDQGIGRGMDPDGLAGSEGAGADG